MQTNLSFVYIVIGNGYILTSFKVNIWYKHLSYHFKLSLCKKNKQTKKTLVYVCLTFFIDSTKWEHICCFCDKLLVINCRKIQLKIIFSPSCSQDHFQNNTAKWFLGGKLTFLPHNIHDYQL